MATNTIIEHVQTGTDSIEIGDLKTGRVKVSFTVDEMEDEGKAIAHIEKMARLKRLATEQFTARLRPSAK